MNLGVAGQAQRNKKVRKSRNNRKKNIQKSNNPFLPKPPIYSNHKKIFQTKIIQVEQRKIGLLIGPNGKNIKTLYQHTHCDIITPKPPKKDNDDDIDDDDFTDQFSSGNFFYTYDAYGDATQTNMKPVKPVNTDNNPTVPDDNKDDDVDLNDPLRLVDIKLRGTAEEIRDAEEEIKYMVQHGRLRLGLTQNAYDNDIDNKEIAVDIRIPSKICGMLIGNSGQKVKEISTKTGCEIWVDWDKSSHIEAGVSTVHLKGIKSAVAAAKIEIKRIQKFFAKGSNNFRFEIPSYCSKLLFGASGGNLKKLQKAYQVTIKVKNFKYEARKIRVCNEEQRVQHTMLITLIGEKENVQACKLGIEDLVDGPFQKCQECKDLTKCDDGHADNYSGSWYCQKCWDVFNGVVTNDDDDNNDNNNNNNLSNKFGILSVNNNNNSNANNNNNNNNQYNQNNNYQQNNNYSNQSGYKKPHRRNKW